MFIHNNPISVLSNHRRPVAILGIPIDNLDMPAVLDRLAGYVQAGRAGGKYYQIATANVDFLVKAQSDSELRYLLQTADLVTPDGMPLVWAARLLGHPLQGRVPGADLVPLLAERAAREGYSIFLFGGGPGIPEKAAQILKARHPNLVIAGTCSPPFMASVADMDPALIQEIRGTHPDILLVALGNPKQEKWIGMYAQSLNVPVLIGIGGSLDFLTSNTKRAPAWIQRVGLEWTYRLLLEPGRLWRRYAVDIYVFGTAILRQLWTFRKQKPQAPGSISIDVQSGSQAATLIVSGTLAEDTISSFEETVTQVLQTTREIRIDLSKTDDIDSVAIGVMINLAKQIHDAQGCFSIVGISKKGQEKLAGFGVQTFLNVFNGDNFTSRSLDGGGASCTAVGNIQTIHENGNPWAVFKAPRLLDTAAGAKMREACQNVFSENPRLIVDLSGTRFLLSGGLAVLKDLKRTALEKKGSLAVKGYTKELLPLLRSARLDGHLTLDEG